MLKTFIMLVLCQLGLLSVSCNVQHDSGFLLQCDSSCTLPEFPGNGRYTVLEASADTLPGAVVPNLTVIQYNCDVGYVPYPHSTAVCIDGIWDTQFTKCQRKVTCPLPTNPAHGSYELSDLGGILVHGTEVPNWSTAIYSCDATFEIVGNRTALCYNGIWTTEPPQCQKTTACVVPDAPAKGGYSILGSQDAPVAGSTVKENQVLLYDCPAPNIPQGPSLIYCENGNWLPEISSCVGNKPCTLPAVPVNGRIVNCVGDVDHLLQGIQVPSLTGVEYSCDELFELTGNDKITCSDGSWSSEPPQCQKTTACVVPDAPANGGYSILGSQDAPVAGSTVKENQVLLYDCPAPNILQGALLIYCKNGNWQPEISSCVGNKPCTLPAVPVNGRIISPVDDVDHLLPGIQVPILSSIEYSCDELFELTGNDKITCRNGSWSSEPPQCQKRTYSIVGSVEAPVPGACLDTPADCGDVLGSSSGIYTIQPTMESEPFEVFCDLTLTGQKWTVIQQRLNGEVDFNRNYTEYSDGFGGKTDSHWLGLEHIHEITKAGHHELYVELEAHNGTKAYARYNTFMVGSSSSGFQLTIGCYRGTAGDSMYEPPGFSYVKLNGMKFSTFDNDQDEWTNGHCAQQRQGAWWYKACGYSNLNSVYHETAVDDWSTMSWYRNFKWNALKTARMLIRRK